MLNKFIAAILIVIACVPTQVRAATTDVAVEWCDLLGTIAYEIGWCYPELTVNNATAVTSNSAQVVVDTDRTNKGIIYVHPTTSCSTAPAVATMLAAQSKAVSGANNTFAISGLTPSTNGYCVWAMQEWDRRYSSIVKTASTFNTLAGAPPPEPEDPAQGSTAPVYYVSYSAGNDSNNGTSSATPWKNLSKVTALTGTTSAKVYLLSGDIWPNQSVDLNWSGTASDYAFFGCYKVVSGSPQICEANDPDPEIHGSASEACRIAKNCPYHVASGGVSGFDDAQITIDADYFRLQDITTRHVIGSGMQVKGSGLGSPGSTKYVELIRPNAYHSGARGIIVLDGVQKFMARDGFIDITGACKDQAKTGGVQAPPNCTSTGNLITGSFPIVRSPECDCLIENMTITRNSGEPMNAYQKTSHVVFRGNRSGNAISVNYTDQSRYIVYESNISWGTQGDYQSPTTSNFGGGWEVNLEDSCTSGGCDSSYDSLGYVNRNNFSLDGGGLNAGVQAQATAAGRKVEPKFFNNAILSSPRSDIQIRRGPATIINLEVKGNIFYTEDSAEARCSVVGTHSGFDYNTWGGPLPAAGCRKSTDKYGIPTFVTARPYSFWDGVDRINQFNIQASDFAPLITSPQYRAGDPSLATRDLIDYTKFSYALSKMQYPFKPNPVTWGKARAYDFYGNLAHPTHPNAGPIEGAGNVLPPEPPPATGGSDPLANTPVTGNVRYFRADGNDSLSGMDHDNAWRSVSKCNNLPIGTDCAFLSGTEFLNQPLRLTRGGTSNDFAHHFCYKMVAGVATYCEDGIFGFGTADPKPVFKGGLTSTCLNASPMNCNFTDPPSNPAEGFPTKWNSMIELAPTADFTKISNLMIDGSRYFGFHAKGSGLSAVDPITDIHVDGLDVQNVGFGSIFFTDGAKRFVLKNSSVQHMGNCQIQKSEGGNNSSVTACANAGWPAHIAVARSSNADGLIDNNYVAKSFGESIVVNFKSSHVVVRNNYMANMWSNGGGTDAATDTIWENNRVLGPQGYISPYYAGAIAFTESGSLLNGAENNDTTDPRNNLYRNNILANTGSGLFIRLFIESVSQGDKVHGWYYNNTIVDPTVSAIGFGPHMQNANHELSDFRGNVFWAPDLSAAAICNLQTVTTNLTKVKNHWSTDPSNSACDGTDDTYGDPVLTVSSTATWNTYDHDTILPFASAQPAAGSPLLNSSDSALLTEDLIDVTKFEHALQHMVNRPDPNFWKKRNRLNALGEDRVVIGNNKGAL